MQHQQPFVIPADVPEKKYETFIKNYRAITRNTGRLFLFSCDQKIEHMNDDFHGPTIHPQALHPEHFFRIATQGTIGAMATHMGLITRYAKQYPDVHYIVKLNATTNLIPLKQRDPISTLLWTVQDVITIKNETKLLIPGVGISVYLGSENEAEQLYQAAHMIAHAHAEGLVAIVWAYPRGKAIHHQNDPELIAGAAGVAVSLGADFAKVKPPITTEILTSAQALKIASAAAGNTKIMCSGGEKIEAHTYLKQIYEQIYIGDAAGTATGRNIFQRSLHEAVALTRAIAAIVYENVDLKTSIALFEEEVAKEQL